MLGLYCLFFIRFDKAVVFVNSVKVPISEIFFSCDKSVLMSFD